jgi:hypothetical protein
MRTLNHLPVFWIPAIPAGMTRYIDAYALKRQVRMIDNHLKNRTFNHPLF